MIPASPMAYSDVQLVCISKNFADVGKYSLYDYRLKKKCWPLSCTESCQVWKHLSLEFKKSLTKRKIRHSLMSDLSELSYFSNFFVSKFQLPHDDCFDLNRIEKKTSLNQHNWYYYWKISHYELSYLCP